MRCRLLGIPLTLAAALALGGCQGLPGSSPVQQGQVVGRGPAEGVRVIPRGPVPGSTPEALVTDFLRAGVASEDSGVARDYLSGRGSEQWHPDGSAWIYDDARRPTVTQVRPGVVTVSGVVSAQLDREGHYVELPPGQVRTATVTLARQGDEWRIDGGLGALASAWISRSDLGLYASSPVAYAAPGQNALILDRRWFLEGSGLLTRVARAQLAAPPAYLQGAAETGVPEYTDLSLGAVALDRGLARVGLTARALNADDRGRRLMWQQLTTTLTSVPGVDRVQLEADGSTLTAPGLPEGPLSATDVSLAEAVLPSSPVLLRRRTTLERVDPASLSEQGGQRATRRPLEGPPLPSVGTQWSRLALSPDGEELAGLDADRRDLVRWRGTRLIRHEKLAQDLTRPAYDARGYLWVAGRTGAGTRLFVLPRSDTSATPPTAVNVPWLADRTVLALRPSPEGQRVLVVSQPTGGGPATVGVSGVLRKDGRPVGLAQPIAVAGALVSVVDATWLDADTLGVLGRGRDLPTPHVVVAPISGPSQILGPVPGGTAITSIGGARTIVVQTDRGQALVRSGNGFQPLVTTGDFVVPGH
ncbi:GerMN domain-containing protein [Arsenicicoccus dermatophilus]|uniref:GerMN domain-containing protein n=1 Tax=Arsenicicoccus dermatophilus TaxID=1076331 RepID=UPI0024096626|nr:GerMN domain-containing protein [Arsenicicoccus dermatophilus]